MFWVSWLGLSDVGIELVDLGEPSLEERPVVLEPSEREALTHRVRFLPRHLPGAEGVEEQDVDELFLSILGGEIRLDEQGARALEVAPVHGDLGEPGEGERLGAAHLASPGDVERLANEARAGIHAGKRRAASP